MDIMIQLALLLLVLLSAASADEVRLLWRLPDVVTYVGALLEYPIPESAFQGTIVRLELQTVLDEPLPKWLTFDPGSRTLRGVPTSVDIGPNDIKVMAYGSSQQSNRASVRGDVFTIFVKEETTSSRLASGFPDKVSDSGEGASSSIYCAIGTPEIVFSLRLQDPASSLIEKNALERIEILNQIAADFNVPAKDVRLLDREYVKELKRSLLQGGKGNVKGKTVSGQLIATWPIACGSALDSTDNALLSRLLRRLQKSQIQVASWNTATYLLPKARRRRFDIFAFLTTPTPEPTTTHQTQPFFNTTTTTMRKTRPRPKPNQNPQPKGIIDTLQCFSGTLCSYKVDDSLFKDDGFTRDLTLTLKALGTDQEQPWVLFDAKNAIIEALPPPKFEARYNYRLTATDRAGLSNSVVFQITVDKKEGLSGILHEFSITLNQDYAQWTDDGQRQMAFIKLLTSYLGSGNSYEVITLTSMMKGSVVIKWKNNTLGSGSSGLCYEDEVKRLGFKLVNPDRTVSTQLLDYMTKYDVVDANFTFLGKCAKSTTNSPMPFCGTSCIYKMVIPIIAIVLLVFIAAIVAICLYKGSKQGRDSRVPSNQAYIIRDGKPVALLDEINWQNDDRGASVTPISSMDYSSVVKSCQ